MSFNNNTNQAILKKSRPITPGTRHKIALKFKFTRNLKKLSLNKELNGNYSIIKSIRKLQKHFPTYAGRNFSGKIMINGRGGGNFKNYKIIDFRKLIWNVPALIKNFVYDPNRNALLAIVVYNNGIISYQIAVNGLKIGQQIISGPNVPILIGNSLPLYAIPTGIQICLIQTNPTSLKGAILCRSAGTFAIIMKKDFETGFATIALRSGIFKCVPLNCIATIGQISNIDYKNTFLGKAGVSRWQGKKPKVRGVAKNPVDHPHGGGQGKTSGGRPSVTPFGLCTKGKKTRKKPKNIFHQTTYIH